MTIIRLSVTQRSPARNFAVISRNFVLRIMEHGAIISCRRPEAERTRVGGGRAARCSAPGVVSCYAGTALSRRRNLA